MNQETIYDGDDVLVIGDDDFVDVDATELDDYLVVSDPTSSDPDSWCVLFISGPFNDFVVKFPDIAMNTGNDEIAYQYTILSPSVDDEAPEYDAVEFANHCTSTLTKIMVEMHKAKTNVYTDVKTGKVVDY